MHRWLEHKTEEDYSVLYYDERYKGKVFAVMKGATFEDAQRWASEMAITGRDLDKLRQKNLPTRLREDILPAYKKS